MCVYILYVIDIVSSLINIILVLFVYAFKYKSQQKHRIELLNLMLSWLCCIQYKQQQKRTNNKSTEQMEEEKKVRVTEDQRINSLTIFKPK